MIEPNADAPDAAPSDLARVVDGLSGASILSAARSCDARRTSADDTCLLHHHRYAIQGLTTTPFMHHVALLAREQGVVAFNRLERAFLPPAPAWRHPEVAADYFALTPRGEALQAPNLWPFAQDCPAGDFTVNIAPKWFTHGLVHTLVGFGSWSGLSEWDVMHMARLSEAVAALHWYWLAELGRLGDDTPNIDLTVLNAQDAAQYMACELDARLPEVRAKRLASERAVLIADNAVDIFKYEAFAYEFGTRHGRLVEPEEPSLEFGEACEYAKVHHRRLTSDAFARWRDHFLIAGEDYATDVDGYGARAANVVKAMLTPLSPRDDVSSARALRAIQDIGQRLCHLAALRGDESSGLQGVITPLSAAATQLRAGVDDADAVLIDVLERVARDVGQPDDGPGPRDVLALGYCPLTDPDREPALSKASRAEALVNRAWALHRAAGTAIEGLKPLATRVVDGVRGSALVTELRDHADPAAREGDIDYFAEAYVGFIDFLSYHWGPADGRGTYNSHWHYRLACEALPPEDAWDQHVVQLNPYLEKLPLPFNARWVAQQLEHERGQVPDLKPRYQTAVEYCFTGPGRRGPIVAALTPHLNGLLAKLSEPVRLDTLIAFDDMSPERVAKAISDELVLCFHKPMHALPEWATQEVPFIEAAARPEENPADYWQEPRQVAAFEAFCETSTLYRDTSRALVERTDISGSHWVCDLGCGTGVTTRAVLERLGPDGQVVGADPSDPMITRARELTSDPRARYIVGDAQKLGVEAALAERPFERAVCNSAIWLSRDIKREAGRVRNAMATDGVFGFSLPAAFLGHTAHFVSPEYERFGAAIRSVREALGHDAAAAPLSADPALGDLDYMRDVLEVCAFGDIDFQLWSRPWPVSEYLDWLSMPVVREGMVPPDKRDESERFIAMVREELDPDMPLDNAWYFIIAKAL